MGLLSKKTTLHVHHAFLYFSLGSLHDYHMKLPNFTFVEDVNKQQRFFLSLSQCESVPKNSTLVKFHYSGLE